jgi:hypothetical protein
MTYMRRMRVLISAVLFACAFGVHGSLPVEATGECGGGVIYRGLVRAPERTGPVVAELVVYFNSATGNNCVRFNRLGPARGVATQMSAAVTRCREQRDPGYGGCHGVGGYDRDEGRFAYYAGPVRVHAPNNCVLARGSIQWNGEEGYISVMVGC